MCKQYNFSIFDHYECDGQITLAQYLKAMKKKERRKKRNSPQK